MLSAVVGMLLLLYRDTLLGEVKCLEVLATLAVPTVNQAKQALPGGISIAASVTVLVYEFLNSEIASAYTNDDLVFLYLHEHTLLPVLVDAL